MRNVALGAVPFRWHSRQIYFLCVVAFIAIGVLSVLSPILLLLGVIGLAALVVVYRSYGFPILAVGLVVASSIISLPLFHLAGRDFFLYEVALGVVGVGWIFRLRDKSLLRRALNNSLSLPVLALGCMYLLSFLRVPDVNVSFGEYSAVKELYRFALAVLAFLIVSSTLDTSRQYLTALTVGAVAALFPAIIGAYLSVTEGLQFAFGSALIEAGGTVETVTSGLWVLLPSAYRFIPGVMAVMGMGFWLSSCTRRARVFWLLSSLLYFQQLLFTGFRTAWLAVAITLLATFFVLKPRYILVTLIVVVVTAMVIAIPRFDPLASNSIWLRIQSIGDLSDISILSRLFYWQLAVELINSNPLFGIGLSQFSVHYEEYDIPWDFVLGPTGRQVHNMYLDVGLSAGLLALGFFVWLVVVSLWQALRLAKSRISYLHSVGMVLLMMVGAFVFMGFFDLPFTAFPALRILLFSLLGMLAGVIRAEAADGLLVANVSSANDVSKV